MSRTGTLILLGILIILAPFSGLPMAMRSLLAVVFGACVTAVGIAMRAHETSAQQSAEPVQPSTSTEPAASELTPPSGVSPI